MKKQELRFTGVTDNADTHIQLHIVKVDSGDGNERAIAVYTDSAEAEKHAKSIRKTTGFEAWSLYAEVQYKDYNNQ